MLEPKLFEFEAKQQVFPQVFFLLFMHLKGDVSSKVTFILRFEGKNHNN
jgi:hypothetical protein